MNEQAELKKAKDRSPSFPFIALERALDRAAQFYAEERRGIAPYTRTVMHWKYSEASSGGLQTIAALKSYGLLNEVGGSGKARQFQLSDLALRVVLDKRPEDEAGKERLELLRRAALSPAVAAEVHDRWPDQLPSSSTLHHFLVVDRKFNEDSAKLAIKILKENQVFAKLDSNDLQSSVDDLNSESMADAELDGDSRVPQATAVQKTRPVAAQAPAHPLRHPSSPPLADYSEHILYEDGQRVTLIFSQPPDSAVYDYIREFSAFRANILKTKEQKAAAQKPSNRAEVEFEDDGLA